MLALNSICLLRLLAGACEVAHDLSTAAALEAKIQQVLKEAFAIWWNNAKLGVFEDVKMLLTDGKCFMMVAFHSDMKASDLQLSTSGIPGLDFNLYRGEFT